MQFKPRETLTEQVAQHIENMIVFGQLKSGQRIYEGPMAKELDVSHGSVREALLLLEKRHLVRSTPRKGTFVTELDEHFVRSLYEAMQLYLTHTDIKLLRHWTPDYMEHLESLYEAMNDCYRRGQLMEFLNIGMEYAQCSITYADNYFIVSALLDLWPSAKRCAFVALRQGPAVIESNLRHMRRSLDTLKARDEAALARITDEYAKEQCEQVLNSLAKQRPSPGQASG
ncbi:MAG: GntR family transcriptional regulator [Hahellaceae bacterium]|nr:GntR family transcriptional regulator [Hahellaceae bacterium]MCP5168359.1 GntR family transcriptional regulator [Hahellaceae bacterium]